MASSTGVDLDTLSSYAVNDEQDAPPSYNVATSSSSSHEVVYDDAPPSYSSVFANSTGARAANPSAYAVLFEEQKKRFQSLLSKIEKNNIERVRLSDTCIVLVNNELVAVAEDINRLENVRKSFVDNDDMVGASKIKHEIDRLKASLLAKRSEISEINKYKNYVLKIEERLQNRQSGTSLKVLFNAFNNIINGKGIDYWDHIRGRLQVAGLWDPATEAAEVLSKNHSAMSILLTRYEIELRDSPHDYAQYY